MKSSASIRQSVRSSDYFQLYFTGKYIIIIMQGDTQSVIGLGATENSQPKILIVDDDERTLRLLCAQVSGCGYNYITSTDGTDAVNKAEFANPDVILLDVLIPGISGIETCRQLKGKKETRHIPVITLTSSTDRDVRINCLEAGASDFIGKPVDLTELLIKIKNLIQLKEYEDLKVKNAILSETITLIETAKREWEQSMDCIRDAVFLVDMHGHILRCNKMLCRLTGKSFGELISSNWQEVMRDMGGNGFSDKITGPGFKAVDPHVSVS